MKEEICGWWDLVKKQKYIDGVTFSLYDELYREIILP
jgi:hypothetical protein